MKQPIGFIVVIVLLLSCNTSTQPEKLEKKQAPIEGTWELLSGTTIQKEDTTITDYTKGQKMIKIINATHFAFFRHDLSKGKDSAVYSSGGGRYSLSDSQYTEHLDYCDAREWEGHTFQFTVSIKNDTLVQTGIEKLENLGVNRLIIEKYVRVKK
jgi:hypothetical protein